MTNESGPDYYVLLLPPLDDGVDHRPAVPHYEDPLGAGEDPEEIFCELQGQWVLGVRLRHSTVIRGRAWVGYESVMGGKGSSPQD